MWRLLIRSSAVLRPQRTNLNRISRSKFQQLQLRQLATKDDVTYSRIITEQVNKITKAFYDGGFNANLETNGQLSRAVDVARNKGVSQATIQRTLTRLENLSNVDKSNIFHIEAQCLDNVALIVEVASARPKPTENMINGLFKKFAVKRASAKHLFREIGVVQVAFGRQVEKESDVDMEELEDLAIDVDAEDVQLACDGETNEILVG